ncbi:Ammonium transporter [Hondaea fermentalgiana]|uniref:Ammonium transporter n=1 Tax=Hondaea fermentalgiana TaxID=2315210 RepID=A0A2R5GCT6_9STRA|nr:Ammonium transporter [Hondaea fermentalgiana]|eukprot:GBG28790.1 Ammonium transporter [Hondaea fermentalgiana]
MSSICDQYSGESQTLCNDLAGDLNVFFTLWATSCVFFMHAGFAMLSAGAVRTKSTTNILICVVMDCCACAFAWWLMGWALAYGEDKGSFIGTTQFVGMELGESVSYIDWLFQFAFAATAATIVSGAVAERATFESYLTYSFYLSAIIYPVVVHWVWGGGFLTLNGDNAVAGVGALDFAGCGPVHMVGGVAGAVGSYLIGPRLGRFDSDGKPLSMPGHSTPLATLGTFILWMGWLGFNPGSVLALVGNSNLAARAAVNTILSSATGGLSSLLFSTYINPGREWDINGALNGVLAGLVSITGGCPVVTPWGSLIIGLFGGIVYQLGSKFVLLIMKLDDPLDAVAVHAITGMYGLIVVGFFAKTEFVQELAGFDESVSYKDFSGVFYGGNGKLLGCQLVEIAVILPWVSVLIFPYFYLLRRFNWLRISARAEEIGIDNSSHGGHAYPDFFPDMSKSHQSSFNGSVHSVHSSPHNDVETADAQKDKNTPEQSVAQA